MRKNSVFLLLVFLILLAIGSIGGLVWWKTNIASVSESDEKISFVVPRGYSAIQVANKLYDEELIKSPLAFKIFVQVSGKSKNINAGEFQLSRNMDLSEIVETFGKGPLELWVTIPEGLRREEIAAKFIEGLEMDAVIAETFGTEFLKVSEGKEGYLFPDTYLFPRDVSAGTVVNRLLITLDSNIDEEMQKKIDNSNYDLNDFVTMASIIEREAITNEERPIIAGILWKRLETQGWLIQADATIQYEIGSKNCAGKELTCDDWWPILTKEDIEVLSPYNSYSVDSLPPSPIASPGFESLKASIFPETSQYWFYIHDPEGNIHYASSIEEHNSNVRNFLGK